MIIDSIALLNFRNYKHLNINLSSGINVFHGNNAQGKTNILEAIYLCATSKSHRTNKEKEIILFGEEESHLRITVNKNNIYQKIDVHLKKNNKKGIAVNGITLKKMNELFGIVNVILFSPEDLSIIKDGPKQRRRFIDLELCQLDPIYYFNLQQYHKVLKQRNNLLKQLTGKESNILDLTKIWDDQLINYGIKIIKRREIFINDLNNIIKSIHKKLTGDKEDLTIIYEKNIDIESFYNKLVQSFKQDLKNKNTLFGPHKDDINFLINKIDVRKYGSQGQQRTCALSLKLAEINLVKEVINDNPILLLDDVLSELDENRQKFLLENINQIQTIITCTGIDDFIRNNLSIDMLYKVENGSVKQIFKD